MVGKNFITSAFGTVMSRPRKLPVMVLSSGCSGKTCADGRLTRSANQISTEGTSSRCFWSEKPFDSTKRLIRDFESALA